jgi:hypothetical protein
MMVINKENIEEYLLLLIDGELSEADEMQVMTFVENHAEYQLLLDQYLDTKLEDEHIVFEGKEDLIKPEENVVPFRKAGSKIFAWAAAIGGVIWIGVAFQLMHSNKIASTSSIGKHVESANRNVDSVPKQPLVATVQKEETTGKQAVQHFAPKQINVSNGVAQNITVDGGYKNVSDPVEDTLKPLTGANFKPLNANADMTANVASLQIPQSEIEEMEPENNNNGLPDASRLEGVNALLAQVETLKENVESKAKIFKNMTVAIRLGGKEFTIGK